MHSYYEAQFLFSSLSDRFFNTELKSNILKRFQKVVLEEASSNRCCTNPGQTIHCIHVEAMSSDDYAHDILYHTQ